MRFTNWLGGLLILLSSSCGESLENVEMVPLENLPEPVIATAKEKLPDVKFDTAWKEYERENGEDVYEVRGKTTGGKTRDIKVSASGKTLEVDKRVTLCRRFFGLAALAFWQGGFSFYAAVVVPLAEHVLSSPIEQGFITRRVTNYLNLAGAIALVVLLRDMSVARSNARARGIIWCAMAATLLILVFLHPRVDQFLDAEATYVLDHTKFYVAHQCYLIVSALQWFCSLAFVVLTLQAWRAEDVRQQVTSIDANQPPRTVAPTDI